MLFINLAMAIGLAAGLSIPNSVEKRQAYTGDMTYYTPGLGACGVTSSEGQNVVAISAAMYDAAMVDGNPNDNPLCGKTISASYNGNSIDLTVVDRCTGCNTDDIDVSMSAFSQLADPSLGRVQVTWSYV